MLDVLIETGNAAPDVLIETANAALDVLTETANVTLDVQGGSDKSGIFKVFFKNHTAQLKIIRF